MGRLAIAWLAWCSLHSLLISTAVGHIGRRLLGRFAPFYRLLYVLVSALSLVPVLWLQFSLPASVIVPASLPLRLGQLLLLAYGLFMFYAGGRAYDMSFFLGIRQLSESIPDSDRLPFRTDGVLAHVRHPWYSGGIALIWGFGAITDVFLLTRIILTGYIVIGTLLEERRLVAELGGVYQEYQRRVPMLFPWRSVQRS